jgi:predicted DCC family thiol-disulfide oxidoreductase YuxK
MSETKSIVLFDGVCNFCNGSVNFIIGRDAADRFRFAALQSETGRRLVEQFGLSEIDSIILIEDDKAYIHSTAALRIARRLGGILAPLYAGIIVPKFMRDFLYKTFASNRYRLFGRKDECMIPSPQVRAKFLD